MAFRTQDLRKTVRRERGASGGLRRLYPRLLRDDSVTPKVALAIRFFETKLGTARRELDGETLTQLFGDPKLARCIVGCLGRWYRYRARTFADVLGEERAAGLAEQGLRTPRDLRALAFERANHDGGFVHPSDRARFLADLERDTIQALYSTSDMGAGRVLASERSRRGAGSTSWGAS